jgi:hypothetical protein
MQRVVSSATRGPDDILSHGDVATVDSSTKAPVLSRSVWTIVRENFADDERTAVRDALEEIASPLDAYGWSSAGAYCFWDSATHEVLYIGLAKDLPHRFAQHVGLVGCPAAGCKRRQIDSWFGEHRTLGYSVLLQTSNIQPIGHRLARLHNIDLRLAREDPTIDLDPLPAELEDLEGRLIEHHRRTFGKWPPWNRKGGSSFGQAQVTDTDSDDLFAIITGVKDNLLVARRSIRQLAEDETAVAFEEHIHTARIRAVMFAAPGSLIGPAEIRAWLDQLDDPFETGARIRTTGYLDHHAPFGTR